MAKRKVRIRAKRLNEIDEAKLSLAVFLIARSIVEDETNPPKPNEADAYRENGEPAEGTV